MMILLFPVVSPVPALEPMMTLLEADVATRRLLYPRATLFEAEVVVLMVHLIENIPIAVLLVPILSDGVREFPP